MRRGGVASGERNGGGEGIVKPYDLTLQGQMAYAKIMLENVEKNDPHRGDDGISYELAKPTPPSKCPKCGCKSYCDTVWIRSTDPKMPPTIMRACPQCGKSVIEARPKGEKPYIVVDLTRDVDDMKRGDHA